MKKDDLKAIFLIIIMLALIAILAIFGLNVYLDFTGNASTVFEIFKEGFRPAQNNTEIQSSTGKIEIEEGGGLEQVELAGSTTVNKEQSSKGYFYNQLNTYSKKIYDKMANNKDKMKTGTYKLEFGETFNDLLKEENGSKLLQDYYQSAVETFLYDNPDVFYLEPTKMYINIKTIKKLFCTTYDVYIDSGKLPNYWTDEFNSEKEILEAEQQVKNQTYSLLAKLEKGTDYEKILMIHDYLINNLKFDESLEEKHIYNIYGALVNNIAVCEGYAKSFKYLANQAGIECIMVIGTAKNSEGDTESHAWNYVKLNNKWYAVDVTWDDPILIGSGFIGNDIKYRYFLKSKATMAKDHFESGRFTEEGQEYNYPELSMRDY